MSITIDYDHHLNLHTLIGPTTVMPFLFGENKAVSLLDVGCGTGTWLKAALDYGITDVMGIDGVAVSADKLHIPSEYFAQRDLTKPFHLGRSFDVALCLEVAEHLDADSAPTLIRSLVEHVDTVFFSAACPGQIGQHHVNCQWPQYWQSLFNKNGFVCSDNVRWKLWNEPYIESWYKQNLFTAKRDSVYAGKEPRLRSVVHPEMFSETVEHSKYIQNDVNTRQIEKGCMKAGWYLQVPFSALASKMLRVFSRQQS